MILNQYKYIISLFVGAVFLVSCNRVTLIVEEIPPNTPIGDDIFIVGNFNDWNPGNDSYQMKLNKDSTYSFILPAGYGNLKYKFTRGSWLSVEKSICGNEIDDRSYNVNKEMTIINSIESWADLDPVNCTERTLCIELLPGNTPANSVIAIASEINSWDPDAESIVKRNSNGEYCLTIQRPKGVNKMEFKVTRGALSNSESDVFGKEVPNRVMEFGKKDTLRISVEGWIDLPMDQPEQVTLILRSIPRQTPEEESIYMASRLNSWKSGDMEYEFKQNSDGQYYINLPRKNMRLDYKVTRDGWRTVEVDDKGFDIGNRNINLSESDSVYIDIIRWKDQDLLGDSKITLVLEELPENTPQDDEVYIAGNFNDWNPGRLKYRFKKNINGNYYVNLYRQREELDFKITRGNWDQEAISHDGSFIPVYHFNSRDFDTLLIQPKIAHWKDLPPNQEAKNVTLVIDHLPKATPRNPTLYFASSNNGWNPQSVLYTMNQLKDGRYYITVDQSGEAFFEYKITRGGWNKAEVDKRGNDIDNRIQYFGFADTVYIEIEGWKDL